MIFPEHLTTVPTFSAFQVVQIYLDVLEVLYKCNAQMNLQAKGFPLVACLDKLENLFRSVSRIRPEELEVSSGILVN